jgi:hypothetical protein
MTALGPKFEYAFTYDVLEALHTGFAAAGSIVRAKWLVGRMANSLDPHPFTRKRAVDISIQDWCVAWSIAIARICKEQVRGHGKHSWLIFGQGTPVGAPPRNQPDTVRDQAIPSFT